MNEADDVREPVSSSLWTPFALIEKLRFEIDKLPNSRERACALTKLDELHLWLAAAKHGGVAKVS